MTEEVNPISNMIDYITQSEFQKANDVFNDILGQRVSDSLDQEKIAIAQAMHAPEEENDEYEVSDEEMEDALDDMESDDESEEEYEEEDEEV